jgi:hypothetical protein
MVMTERVWWYQEKSRSGSGFSQDSVRELDAAYQAALAPSFSLIRADLPLRLRR